MSKLFQTCVYTVAACGEGRQSVAFAGWDSWGLVSNQPDIIKYEIACKQDEKLLSAYDILLHLKRGV